ncbi:hypothetical protein TREAZ_1161 [Leadbettera azotonutricia ZAS-9]|uniref:Uncharacterized protein n=1 Tax=Leadbettera azotonutricia (strain ATCC BAA-888 / DSM 13862 / ZAS-9) TaxID=545695 RepID=F5Y735_LEAAZ|nr:hypothetical protein TREAZ_1161 [Leadbettera azotonutricia ZAS-9]
MGQTKKIIIRGKTQLSFDSLYFPKYDLPAEDLTMKQKGKLLLG